MITFSYRLYVLKLLDIYGKFTSQKFLKIIFLLAQSTGVVEYTDCISAEE